MSETVNVKGLAEIGKLLDQLPERLARGALRGGLRAGGGVIRTEARANINSDSGETARSIKISTRSRGHIVSAKVEAKSYKARWLEYGTRPHTIKARDGGAMAFAGGFYKEVEHPGARPHPFMRPALDTQARAAVVAVAQYLKLRLATKHGLDTSDVEIEE